MVHLIPNIWPNSVTICYFNKLGEITVQTMILLRWFIAKYNVVSCPTVAKALWNGYIMCSTKRIIGTRNRNAFMMVTRRNSKSCSLTIHNYTTANDQRSLKCSTVLPKNYTHKLNVMPLLILVSYHLILLMPSKLTPSKRMFYVGIGKSHWNCINCGVHMMGADILLTIRPPLSWLFDD